NIDEIAVSSYNDISFDVNAADVNKGNAIKDVMEYRKISLANVIAIGDGENDMAMFEVAGHTIAMCNAKVSIQKLCDEISALSNEDDGVSEILQEYFLRQ
ncbi:MAG: HAD family hydrolase, partial [Lactobacillus gallinarum]|uniref:HAD family hydrolase n=1 Tax=Lactobacillus gallinarum TaxID=52242 RepID=UPI00380B9A64